KVGDSLKTFRAADQPANAASLFTAGHFRQEGRLLQLHGYQPNMRRQPGQSSGCNNPHGNQSVGHHWGGLRQDRDQAQLRPVSATTAAICSGAWTTWPSSRCPILARSASNRATIRKPCC